MPPRRRAAAGPVPLDVDALRSALAAGRIVRVGISRSAQFPEGAIGRVKGMGYPATDGEEFIQVEVNLNGTRDVLPFTPADLTPATRSRRSTVVGPSPGNPGASNAPAAFGPPPTPTHRAPRVAQPPGPIGRQPTPPPGQGRAPHTSAEPPDVVQLTLDGSVVPPALSAAPPQDAGATRTPATDARGKRPRKQGAAGIDLHQHVGERTAAMAGGGTGGFAGRGETDAGAGGPGVGARHAAGQRAVVEHGRGDPGGAAADKPGPRRRAGGGTGGRSRGTGFPATAVTAGQRVAPGQHLGLVGSRPGIGW